MQFDFRIAYFDLTRIYSIWIWACVTFCLEIALEAFQDSVKKTK